MATRCQVSYRSAPHFPATPPCEGCINYDTRLIVFITTWTSPTQHGFPPKRRVTQVFLVSSKRDEKHKIWWAVNPPTPRWSRVGSYNDSCKSSLYANPKKTWRARCASVDVLTNHRGKNTIMPWRRDKQQVKVFSPLHPNPPPSSLNHWQQRASEQTATLFPREIQHGYHRNHVPLLNRRVLRRESRSFASLIAKKYKIHADSLLAKQNNNIFPFYCKTPVSARYYISYQDS